MTALALLPMVALTAGCLQDNAYTEQASSDGLRLELGDLLLSDLMVLAAAEGEPGTLLGAVSNDGDLDTEVAITVVGRDDVAETVAVDAGETVIFGPEDTRVRLPEMPEPPGGAVEVEFSSDEYGTEVREIPVLDDTFERYEELVPSPAG